MSIKDLENHIKTIYEAKENGGIINPKEEAVIILEMCNKIRKNIIDEFRNNQQEEMK